MNTEAVTMSHSINVLADQAYNRPSVAVSQCFQSSCLTDRDEQCFVISNDNVADSKQLTELANLIAKVRANMRKAAAELNRNNGEVEVII